MRKQTELTVGQANNIDCLSRHYSVAREKFVTGNLACLLVHATTKP